jgi:hypothetical protein
LRPRIHSGRNAGPNHLGAISGLNKRLDDRADTRNRLKPSGEADNTYFEDSRKQKATTRTKSGRKVHETILMH